MSKTALALATASGVLTAGVAATATAAPTTEPTSTPAATPRPTASPGVSAARTPAQTKAAAVAARKRELKILPGGDHRLPLNKFRVGAGWGDSRGPHAGRNHKGLDFAAPTGAPIYSVTDGKVILARSYYGFGNLVIVKTPTGKRVLYGHQSHIAVKKGQTVRPGTLIGKVGSTGYSTGPHLHFETRTAKDRAFNPLKFLSASKSGLQQRSNKLAKLR